MKVRVRYVLAAAGSIVYAVLGHRLMTEAPGSLLAVLALLGPMAALALWSLWRAGRRLLAGVLGLGTAVLLGWLVRHQGQLSSQWLYFAQHLFIHVGLGLWFGHTLFGGRQPFISKLAEQVHQGLVPSMARYTRQLTVAWTLYFFAMASVSCLLFAFTAFSTWSLFSNVLTPLAIVSLFGGEYWVRYRLHPEFERVTIMRAVHAFRGHRGTETRPAAADPSA